MKQFFTKMLGLVLIVGLFSACDSGVTYPPVSQNATGVHHPGQFVWHDLATPNPNAAMDFYTKVFGWKFNTLGSGSGTYYVITNNDKPIGGMFKLAPKYGAVSEWVGSISVTDVDKALSYNQTNGGTTIFKATTLKGRGNTALAQDPQGAIIAFVTAEGGDPAFGEVEMNSWLWNELWTTDMDGSLKFYQELCGYTQRSVLGSKVPYFVFEKDGEKYSGVLGNPVEDSRSSWMPYIRVSDVEASVKKAVDAGAKLMMEPNENIRKGTVAVLLDPMGAQFTIQQWPIN